MRSEIQEIHPYGEFIPKKPRGMIIGSFPIGKFTHQGRRHEINAQEIDFFFGGERNLLWKLLSDVFQRPMKTKKEIKEVLEEEGLGVGDVIKSCKRTKGGASDSDLYDIEWNESLLKKIEKHKIQKVYFTSKQVARWFNRLFPNTNQLIKITLISPSSQSMRGLVKNKEFVAWKKLNPNTVSYEFILNNYRSNFR